MSVASERGTSGRSTNRNRSSSGTGRASTRGRAPSNGQKSSAKRPSARTAAQPRASQSRAKSQRSASSQRSSSAQRSNPSQRTAISSIVVPVASATIGVAGGVLLGRNARQRGRKIFGVELPPINVEFKDLTQQIGNAGRQFGKLAREVQAVREKAEQIGRAVS